MTDPCRHVSRLALAGLIACAALCAAPPSAEEDEEEAAETSLHRLENKELLARATALIEKASAAYLAHLRELTTLERAAARARQRREEVKVPPPPENGGDVRKAADQARARRDAVKQLQERLGAEKKSLDDLARSVEASRSAALAFLGTFDELEAYQEEIELRVKDGTLSREAAPAALGAAQADAHRKKVRGQQAELGTKADDARTSLEQIAKRLTQADADVQAAESALTQASSRVDREQKRRQMEEAFEARPPAELLEEMTALGGEEPGLKGAFQLARRAAQQQQAEWRRLNGVLTAEKPPAPAPGAVRPEEVAAAVKAAAALLDAQEKWIKAIESVREAFGELDKRGTEFEADAAVLGEHTFRMQVLARVLQKKGDEKARATAESETTRLNAAAAALAKAVAGVQADREQARKADAALVKDLATFTAARTETQARLTALKQAEESTLAAVAQEARLSKMSSADVSASFTKTAAELKEAVGKLAPRKDAYRQASAAVAEVQTKRDALKDPFVREAEEAVRPQRQKLLAELRKESGVTGTTAPPPETPAAPKTDEPPKAAPTPGPIVVQPTDIEKVLVPLRAFQQRIGTRERVMAEREGLRKEVLASLANLEKQVEAYAQALNHARQLARQQYTTAVNLKKRVGRDEMTSEELPAGITEALQPELLKQLDADASELLAARTQAAAQAAALNKPDAALEQADALCKEVVDVLGQRLDLMAELQKLEARYALERKDRPELEAKRQVQRAAELQDEESTLLDGVLRIDNSRAATSLQELLDAYYLEVIEIRDRAEILDQEKGIADRLMNLTVRESEAIKKLLPVLEKLAAAQVSAQEEELILARSRLRPDLAADLLKQYQTRTGRTLPRPQPIADKEKAEKIDELAGRVLERQAQTEAVGRYAALLQERLAGTGLKAEAGVYQNELARIKATGDANRRRVAALTGRGAEEGGKGEIGRVRHDLSRVRRENAVWIVGKVVLIFVVAWFLPRLILGLLALVFGRGDQENESLGLLITSLRAFVRAIVWVIALALIVRVLGFDVTAVLAGLGIGGLAIGLAAKDMLADVISALVIFVERRFKIGDALRIGQEKEPAKVVGLNWRMTQLLGPDGLTYNVPNRTMTNRRIQNLTSGGVTYDSLDVIVTTGADVQPVLEAIREVIDVSPDLGPASERGYCVEKVEHKEGREWRDRPPTRYKVVACRFWWQIRAFEERNRIRDKLLMRISERLSKGDLSDAQVMMR